MTLIALTALAAWLYLVFAHHGFWRADQRLPAVSPPPPAWPAVTALVPARNEVATIGACVAALLAQDYPGRLEVIVIDDGSTDGTAAAATAAGDARLRVIAAPPLADGWTGKLAALQAGIEAAGPTPCLWLTDADIVHGPQVLRRLMAFGVARERDLVSLMVRLHCETVWEKLLIPAFVYFFQMLYPFRAVNDDRSQVAAAAGGCVLLRREALVRAGGLASIAGAVIDDCSLAGIIKRAGGRLWLGLADQSVSLRPAAGLAPLWRMVTRTAFTQLRHSWLLLGGTVASLALIFLAGPYVLCAGTGFVIRAAGFLAVALMVVSYAPTLALYGLPIAAGILLPVAAVLYAAMTVGSAVAHLQGHGAMWKGRNYRTSANPANLPKSMN